MNVWMLLMQPLLGTWPKTQACSPKWEWNWRPFGSQAGTQSTEPHQPLVYILGGVHLGCFCLLAVVNNDAMNMSVQVSVRVPFPPFVEKTTVAPLYCLCFFVKDQLTIFVGLFLDSILFRSSMCSFTNTTL